MAQMVKNLPAMQETQGLIPGWGRSPGGGNSYPLQYSCLGNQKSLAGLGPWGHKQLDMTKQLTLSLVTQMVNLHNVRESTPICLCSLNFYLPVFYIRLPWWLSSKESVCQCRSLGFYPWVGNNPGERNGNLFQYSCLGNATDTGAWWATVHGIAKELNVT